VNPLMPSMKTVSFRMWEKDHETLQRIAEARGLRGASDVVRVAIKQFMTSNNEAAFDVEFAALQERLNKLLTEADELKRKVDAYRARKSK
jgi:hypothetical protein